MSTFPHGSYISILISIVGVLQNFARKFLIPIDKLGFEYEVTKLGEDQQHNVKPDNGAYIYVSIFQQGFICYWVAGFNPC